MTHKENMNFKNTPLWDWQGSGASALCVEKLVDCSNI